MLRETRGAAVVEFALVSTLLIGLLLPLIDVGMGFYYKDQIMTAAQAGAQHAFENGYSGSDPTAITSVITSATGLPASGMTATATRKCGCWTMSGGIYALTLSSLNSQAQTTCTSGTTKNPATTCSSSSARFYLTSHAETTYRPLLRYGGFGSSIDLSADSTVVLP
jgi:Flp pilus assembly protein TadG